MGRKKVTDMTVSTLDQSAATIEGYFDSETAVQPHYTDNSARTFMLRYSRKDANGEPTETPAQAHWRVALNVASVTVLYVEGADWQEGDAEPSAVNPQELDFPFRTIARQYNQVLGEGRQELVAQFIYVKVLRLDAKAFEIWKFFEQVFHLLKC